MIRLRETVVVNCDGDDCLEEKVVTVDTVGSIGDSSIFKVYRQLILEGWVKARYTNLYYCP